MQCTIVQHSGAKRPLSSVCRAQYTILVERARQGAHWNCCYYYCCYCFCCCYRYCLCIVLLLMLVLLLLILLVLLLLTQQESWLGAGWASAAVCPLLPRNSSGSTSALMSGSEDMVSILMVI